VFAFHGSAAIAAASPDAVLSAAYGERVRSPYARFLPISGTSFPASRKAAVIRSLWGNSNFPSQLGAKASHRALFVKTVKQADTAPREARQT